MLGNLYSVKQTMASASQSDTMYVLTPHVDSNPSDRLIHHCSTIADCTHWRLPYGVWSIHTHTHTRQTVLCPWGTTCFNVSNCMSPGRRRLVLLIIRTLTPNPLSFMRPPFVLATNSVLNRIIITEQISHIKPLPLSLAPQSQLCAAKKAWQDIRRMWNEICINSVAPSLIYFLPSAKKKKKKTKWKMLTACWIHPCGCIKQVLLPRLGLH